MLMKICSIIGCCALLLCNLAVFSQISPATPGEDLGSPDAYLGDVLRRTDAVQLKMQKTTAKYLTRMQKLEKDLKKRLAIHHPAEAAGLFGDAQKNYGEQLTRLRNEDNGIHPFGNVYSEQLDSLSTAVKFLDRYTSLPVVHGKLQQVGAAVAKAQGNLNQSMAINQFLEERQKFLQERLSQFGMARHLVRFKQQVLRYREDAARYKALLEDPKALGAKALDHIKKLPAFRQFFSNHSQLASLFVLPGATDPDVGKNSVTGLQTRSALEKEAQIKYGKGVSLRTMVARNVRAATQNTAMGLPAIPTGLAQQLQTGDVGADPGQAPSFRKRWEWGLNVQTLPSNGYWPARTDVGLTAGYMVSENHTAGIETAFRIGWGKDWQHLALSGQGAGGRAYWESRLKGSFWLTAGMGLNYQRAGEGHLPLSAYNPWQKTLQTGVVKKYRIGSKMKGNIQLLYDFFHDTHIPATPSWMFRVGYGF